MQVKVQEKLPDALGRLKPRVHPLTAETAPDASAPGAAPDAPGAAADFVPPEVTSDEWLVDLERLEAAAN